MVQDKITSPLEVSRQFFKTDGNKIKLIKVKILCMIAVILLNMVDYIFFRHIERLHFRFIKINISSDRVVTYVYVAITFECYFNQKTKLSRRTLSLPFYFNINRYSQVQL